MTKLAMNTMPCKLSNGERDDPLGSDQDELQQDVLVDVVGRSASTQMG